MPAEGRGSDDGQRLEQPESGVIILPPFVWITLPGTAVEVRNHEATRDVVIAMESSLSDFARSLPDEAVLSFRRAQL